MKKINFLVIAYIVLLSNGNKVYCQVDKYMPTEYIKFCFKDATGQSDSVVIGYFYYIVGETPDSIVSTGVDSLFGEKEISLSDTTKFTSLALIDVSKPKYNSVADHNLYLKNDVRNGSGGCLQSYYEPNTDEFQIKLFNYKLPVMYYFQRFGFQCFQGAGTEEWVYVIDSCGFRRSFSQSNKKDTIKCSNFIGINIGPVSVPHVEPSESKQFFLNPNPVGDSFVIYGIDNKQIDYLEIFNIYGVKCLSRKNLGMASINCSALQSGIYIVKLTSIDKTYRNFKIIKE